MKARHARQIRAGIKLAHFTRTSPFEATLAICTTRRPALTRRAYHREMDNELRRVIRKYCISPDEMMERYAD